MTPRLARWRRFTDAPLLILAIGSLPLLLLEPTRHDLAEGDRLFLDVVNVVVLVAFALDYVIEFALARPRRNFVRGEWTSLLVVVAQALALVPSLTGFGVLRILRAGRAWRAISVIARVAAISGAAAKEGRGILRRHAAGFALGVAGLTWLSSAVAFTLVEDVGEDGRLESFGDALWWATTTITTTTNHAQATDRYAAQAGRRSSATSPATHTGTANGLMIRNWSTTASIRPL